MAETKKKNTSTKKAMPKAEVVKETVAVVEPIVEEIADIPTIEDTTKEVVDEGQNEAEVITTSTDAPMAEKIEAVNKLKNHIDRRYEFGYSWNGVEYDD